MDLAGPTHTRRCADCGAPAPDDTYCRKHRAIRNGYHNPQRVWVAGKYAGTQLGLGIPAGRYKNWRSAHETRVRELYGTDLKSLEAPHVSVREGFVYVIANDVWPGVVKIGSALSAESRLRSFQTSDPYRNYRLIDSRWFADRREAERQVHQSLEDARQGRGEWFMVSAEKASQVLSECMTIGED